MVTCTFYLNDSTTPTITITKLNPLGIQKTECLMQTLHGLYVRSEVLVVMEIRTANFRHVARDYMASIDHIKVPTEISRCIPLALY